MCEGEEEEEHTHKKRSKHMSEWRETRYRVGGREGGRKG